MKQMFELTITGEIPEDNADIGPEAQVASKAPAAEIVAALHKLGLLHVHQHRRIVRKKDAVPGPTRPALIQPAAE